MNENKISEEDRLQLELSYIKIRNLELQGRILQLDFEKAGKMLVEEQKKLKSLVEAVNSKYGIEIGKDTLASDGTITRAGS